MEKILSKIRQDYINKGFYKKNTSIVLLQFGSGFIFISSHLLPSLMPNSSQVSFHCKQPSQEVMRPIWNGQECRKWNWWIINQNLLSRAHVGNNFCVLWKCRRFHFQRQGRAEVSFLCQGGKSLSGANIGRLMDSGGAGGAVVSTSAYGTRRPRIESQHH